MTYRVLWLQTQQAFAVGSDESVLEAAMRQGVDLPHECTFGGCGTCRMKIETGSIAYVDGELPMSMTEEEHAQGYALACQARPESDLVISVDQGPACSPAQVLNAAVTELRLHSPDIHHLALQLPPGHGLRYAPGQYLNIQLGNDQVRSFSIANPPQGDRLTLQIRRIPGGQFTDQILAETRVGDTLQVELPLGSFHYHTRDYQPMLFAATGTGFAPVKAILESLLDDEDCPPIHFYWGMRNEQDLYLLDEIKGWSSRLYEFQFIPVLSRPSPAWTGRRGYVQDAIIEDFEDLSEHSIYLCGSPEMIEDAKALMALSGAALDKIYVDSFLFQNSAAAALAASN